MVFQVLCGVRLNGLNLFLTDLSLVPEFGFIILVAKIWGWGPVVGGWVVLGQRAGVSYLQGPLLRVGRAVVVSFIKYGLLV